MKVLKTYPTSEGGHLIEVVQNEHGLAVRSRYQNSNGGYNTASPIVLRKDIVLLARAAADFDLLTIGEIARVMIALGAAVTVKMFGLVSHLDGNLGPSTLPVYRRFSKD